MTVPDWWVERRYGMRLHASVATVPSFSPIGEAAEYYWAHLGTDALAGIAPHPSPMAEVLAYHRDRWSHVARYDDFVPFLSYHRFDADEHVELALDAGMNLLVQDVKQHDGFCWWDAPGTTRSSVHAGPRRDVVGEIVTAARRAGMVVGAGYSLFDWAEHRPDRRFATVGDELADLIERYGVELLWGDGADALAPLPPSARNAIADALDRARELAELQGIELALNDGWTGDGTVDGFAVFGPTPPPGIVTAPWVLRRPLGASACFNRAERDEHLLGPGALVDLLTEVVAKGGTMVVDVGPGFDGSIPDTIARTLRDVGTWVYDHADVVHGSRPFDVWGDARFRYVQVPAEAG
ncbi:MAG TPA: alpha-L-fucosidase, partial [Ilumatobacteraceae bacterium]|nr:alpha-L-fucosidase [Ilumatobacteraceae bacterium]